jgi:phosphoenolpyruvate carboxykinase (GTP)
MHFDPLRVDVDRAIQLVDVEHALDRAGLKNVQVREYVRFWAELTGAGRVEVISAADDARLIEDALMAGAVLPAGDGL